MGSIKKGQSSVEYLSTYAWAFLGLIVTIGALSYFGILNPSTYTPERCTSGSQITCVDHYVAVNPNSGATTILYLFKNTYPRNITILNTTITNLASPLNADEQNIIVMPGRTYVAHFTTTSNFLQDQKETLQFTITYKRTDPLEASIAHNITGSSISIVQKISGTSEPYCGDGNVDDGEQCDPVTHYDDGRGKGSQCGGNVCRSDCTCAT